MIELFSRKPKGMVLKPKTVLTPLHVEESIASLSAILLNDAYYRLLLEGKQLVDGFSVLSIEYLILFKIRAWLDLSDRVATGDHVDSSDIKKHKNDIFRLFTFITPPSTAIAIDEEIKTALDMFIRTVPEAPPDLPHLGIRFLKLEQVLEIIQGWYQLRG